MLSSVERASMQKLLQPRSLLSGGIIEHAMAEQQTPTARSGAHQEGPYMRQRSWTDLEKWPGARIESAQSPSFEFNSRAIRKTHTSIKHAKYVLNLLRLRLTVKGCILTDSRPSDRRMSFLLRQSCFGRLLPTPSPGPAVELASRVPLPVRLVSPPPQSLCSLRR